MKNVGGQAVIEGVMMRAPEKWGVAVRDTKGNIHVKTEELSELSKPFKMPLVRGFIALFYALFLGVKAIEFSANKAYDEAEGKLTPLAMAGTMGFAFILAILLFLLLPLYATKLVGIAYSSVSDSSFMFNIVDGIIRVFVFLIYVVSIGFWKDMKRIFEYHGAEHKVIHAYEAGESLTIENIKKYSIHHARCGTSFLLIVMVISIFIFSFIPQEWSFLYKFGSRLLLIPLVAGLSYEMLKLSSKLKENFFMKIMIMPGLMLQRLTTSEPDDKQIEVAVRALKEVL
ncbi:MAG: DUF1385 domain-containing protein [Nitrospiraceae bacterium]|nr:DUF1385 domain-containing protein [Nitrospiraceae bacterium]